jgi:DNA-directed RNA polymerase specialized sigma24 family protein
MITQMTKKRLEQYRNLKNECASIERQLEGMADTYGVDVVKSSMSEHPYIERHVVVEGVGATASKRRLLQRKAVVAAELDAVERYVDGIQDSRTRQMLDAHYLRGLTWELTAEEIGVETRTCHKILEKISLKRAP